MADTELVTYACAASGADAAFAALNVQNGAEAKELLNVTTSVPTAAFPTVPVMLPLLSVLPLVIAAPE